MNAKKYVRPGGFPPTGSTNMVRTDLMTSEAPEPRKMSSALAGTWSRAAMYCAARARTACSPADGEYAPTELLLRNTTHRRRHIAAGRADS